MGIKLRRDGAWVEVGGGLQGVQGIQGLSGGVGATLSISSQGSAYTLTASDAGTIVKMSANVTIPQNIFSAGESILIYNDTSSPLVITQGTGTTLRLPGTSSTGNRSLAQRGIATILCIASNEFLITGTGVY